MVGAPLIALLHTFLTSGSLHLVLDEKSLNTTKCKGRWSLGTTTISVKGPNSGFLTLRLEAWSRQEGPSWARAGVSDLEVGGDWGSVPGKAVCPWEVPCLGFLAGCLAVRVTPTDLSCDEAGMRSCMKKGEPSVKCSGPQERPFLG